MNKVVEATEDTAVDSQIGSQVDGDDEMDAEDLDDLSLMDELFSSFDDKGREDKETQAKGSEGTEAVEEVVTEGQEGDETLPAKEEAATETPPEKAEEPKPTEAVAEPAAEPQGQTAWTPEQRAEAEAQLEKFNNEAREYLANNVYKLTEEQAEELETDPVSALPKLAANMHLQVMRAATQNVARLLPQMVEAIQNTQTTSKSLEDKFFGKHPQLKEHQQTVVRFGQVYRQLNPTATVDDFIRDVGAQAKVALGLHEAPPTAKPAAQKTPPFSPALAGGQGGAPLRTAPTNEFEALAEELLHDDD